MRFKIRIKFHKDLVEMKGDTIIVGIMARPEKGLANDEMIKKVGKFLKIAPSEIRLISGFRSTQKVIEIKGFKK